MAIYAALVATGSALWQVVTWVLGHRTRVEVQVATGAVLLVGQPALDVVIVTAINRSAHPVRVTNVGIDYQDQTDRWLIALGNHPADTMPGVVQPHDSGEAHLSTTDLAARGIDLHKPVVGRVRLATGKPYKSKPRALLG